MLLDAANASGSGGTGTTFDHTVQTDPQVLAQILLAGGLSPVNAAEAAFTDAAGFDFNSGVEEAPGIKSAEKIHSAFAALRGIPAPKPHH